MPRSVFRSTIIVGDFFVTDAMSNDEIKGSVIAVHDGNTLEVVSENNENPGNTLQFD